MHADGRVKLGIRVAHDGGRRAAGREPGDIDALWIDRVVAHHLAGDPRDQRRLALVAPLVALAEPVPALLQVRRTGLPGIGDQAGGLFGRLVHAGARGEVVGRLGAAMQHDDQGNRLPTIAAGHVELVGTASGPAAESGCQEPRAVRHGDGRRGCGQMRQSSRPAAAPSGRRAGREGQGVPRTSSAALPASACRSAVGRPRRQTSARVRPLVWPPPVLPLRLCHRWWGGRAGPGAAAARGLASAMPSMVGGPRRACGCVLPGAAWPPSMRCRAAVASVSRPALVRRVASSRSLARVFRMSMAFCAGDPVTGVPVRSRDRLPSSFGSALVRTLSAIGPGITAGRACSRRGGVSACGRPEQT